MKHSEEGYTVLEQPLTARELRARMDDNSMAEAVVQVELSEIIDNDLEGFLDILSDRMTGTVALLEVDYDVVGHEGNALHIRVQGNVETILDEIG